MRRGRLTQTVQVVSFALLMHAMGPLKSCTYLLSENKDCCSSYQTSVQAVDFAGNPTEPVPVCTGGVGMPVSNGDLFGLGSNQHLAPVSQPEEAPVAAVGNGPGRGAPEQTRVHTSSNPEEVRAFLHGGAGASGLNVSRWDTVDEEVVKRAEALSRYFVPLCSCMPTNVGMFLVTSLLSFHAPVGGLSQLLVTLLCPRTMQERDTERAQPRRVGCRVRQGEAEEGAQQGA